MDGGFPIKVAVFKSDKDAGAFITRTVEFSKTTRKSAGGSVYVCALVEGLIGESWDERCLGLAITFGGSASSLKLGTFIDKNVMSGSRSPVCSYMSRNMSGNKTKTHRLGTLDRTGLPISSVNVGNHLFIAWGTYCGVGFGNDLSGCEPFIKLMDSLNDRKGECWQSASRYAKLFDRCAPFSGAACNTGSIAYVAGVSFHGDEDTRLMVTGVWGNLLKALAYCEGVQFEYDGAVVSRRFIRADDYDTLYSSPTFMLVGCLEYITSAMAGELIETIKMPSGLDVRVGNDIGLYHRNNVCVRRR